MSSDGKLRIGISACLLGESVRYNGGHKRDPYVVDTLGPFFEWMPVCPEVEAGMGTPREAVRLVGDPQNPRMVGSNSGEDWTDRMQAYTRDRVDMLSRAGLHGYILKNRSPSCGLFRVKVYQEQPRPPEKGSGLFAAALAKALPGIPIEEEGRLNDTALRENFIVRVFSYHRWCTLLEKTPRAADLIAFHAQHKYLLLAHSPQKLRELGRIVAGIKGRVPAAVLASYRQLFDQALCQRATLRKHTNVLQHIAGHFKKEIEPGDKQELHAAIQEYFAGLVPLVVPMTLIRHHARRLGVGYIADQVYLQPHPKELMLLNHI